MTIFALSALINAITSLLLFFVILFKKQKTVVHKTFLGFCFSAFFWSIFYFFWQISETDFLALIFCRLLMLGAIFIPIFFLHFVLAFLGLDVNKKKVIIGAYIFGAFSSVINFTNLFVSKVEPSTIVAFWPKPGFYFTFYLIVWGLIVYYSIKLLISHYKKSSGNRKKQIFFIILGVAMGFIGGSTNYFLWYDINLPPYGNILASVYVFFTAYAIITSRFMDVKFVLRQSVVYITSLVATVFFAVILKYNIYFFFQVSENYWVDLFLISTALFVFPLLKNYCYHLANKYFFTSLYDSKKVIAELSEKLSSTLEPHLISQAVEESLTKSLHPKAMALFDFNEATEVFDIKFNYGFKLKSGNLKVGRYILQNYFFKKSVLLLDDLHPVSAMRVEPFLKEFRDKLGIEVIVPMIIKNKAVGFLALGTKESGDAYNNEDIQLLSVIGTQVAMSLENSWLYEETRNFNIKLTKEIDKATKDLRRANAELKRLDAAKSEFISIASHQLRTPLTVIKGYSSMMLEGSFGHMPEPIEGNIRKIYESNERLINLVEDLLNISRIESGRMKFDFTLDSLESVVDSVVEEMMIAAKNKNLTLNYEKPDRLTPKVKLDKMKLRQVIINIIDNAVKYTNEGSVTVKISEQNGYVRCSVTDTGMGISATDLQHLFKKFSRGESISLVHTEGTGLGLYVGKMMIEEHGGRIWAESMGEGKGSTFAFDLPVFK